MADSIEEKRQAAAKRAVGGLSDEFKKAIGPGLAVLLEQQGVSQADVEEWQSASPNDSVDLVKAAKGALGKRIAKNYPKWDDAKINQYINEGTASDGPERGMPEGEFPAAETLPSVGEPDYSMPMQEGESFPPPETLPPGNPDQAPKLKAPSDPAVDEADKEDAKQKQQMGADRSAVPSSYKDRLEQMFQVYK